MANDLAEYRVWLQVMLGDAGAKSWDVPGIDSAIRLALLDMVRVTGAVVQVKDLDGANYTTVEWLDRGTLLLGVCGYAAKERALDLSEKGSLGEKTLSTMADYARDQLKVFNDQLERIGRRLQHASPKAPYTAWYWEEGSKTNQGATAPAEPPPDFPADPGPDPEEELNPMERENRTVSAIIASGAAVSGVIDATWAAAQGLKAPAALEATTVLAFKVSESQDGTFLPLYSELNVLVEVPVTLNAARAYQLPDELFAWPYFKLWTEAAGVDVAQSADRSFVVALKS